MVATNDPSGWFGDSMLIWKNGTLTTKNNFNISKIEIQSAPKEFIIDKSWDANPSDCASYSNIDRR